jgi:putative polyhydroxyalkanoate system protein
VPPSSACSSAGRDFTRFYAEVRAWPPCRRPSAARHCGRTLKENPVPDIRIHREHQLGLAKARKVAWQWAEQAEAKFDMECTVIEGETSDTVEFTRTGVKGRLIVAADHFDLDAKLGFLLGAFSQDHRGRDPEEPRRPAGQELRR